MTRNQRNLLGVIVISCSSLWSRTYGASPSRVCNVGAGVEYVVYRLANATADDDGYNDWQVMTKDEFLEHIGLVDGDDEHTSSTIDEAMPNNNRYRRSLSFSFETAPSTTTTTTPRTRGGMTFSGSPLDTVNAYVPDLGLTSPLHRELHEYDIEVLGLAHRCTCGETPNPSYCPDRFPICEWYNSNPDEGGEPFFICGRASAKELITNLWHFCAFWYIFLLVALIATKVGRRTRGYVYQWSIWWWRTPQQRQERAERDLARLTQPEISRMITTWRRRRIRRVTRESFREARREALRRDPNRVFNSEQRNENIRRVVDAVPPPVSHTEVQMRVISRVETPAGARPNALALKTMLYRSPHALNNSSDKKEDASSSTTTTTALEPPEEDEDRESCVICMGPLRDGVDKVGVIPCGHNTLHVECLKDWLKRRNTCPLCNQSRIAVPRVVPQAEQRDDEGDDNENQAGTSSSGGSEQIPTSQDPRSDVTFL